MSHGFIRMKGGGGVTFEGFLAGKMPCYILIHHGNVASIVRPNCRISFLVA